MFQAAMAFSGGMAIANRMEAMSLPKLRRPVDNAPTFKLSVRVVAASVPGLEVPGFITHHRPFLELSLGSTSKATEFADFNQDSTKVGVGACASECPWRFSDALTFRARKEDILGQGLRVALHTRKDVHLGPVCLEMKSILVGEGTIDLAHRVLPACTQEASRPDAASSSESKPRAWVSPIVLVPLSHVRGSGSVLVGGKLGEAAATAALVFSLDVDPEYLLDSVAFGKAALKGAVENVGRAIDNGFGGVARWLDSPSSFGQIAKEQKPLEIDWLPDFYEPINPDVAIKRAQIRGWSVVSPEEAMPSPDLDPNGWISHRGPDRRLYWHHRSLGPAPWEAGQGETSKEVKCPKTESCNPLPSPEEQPDGWICHTRSDGRIFWHHQALGPAPWEGHSQGDQCCDCSLDEDSAKASKPAVSVKPLIRPPSGCGEQAVIGQNRLAGCR